MIKNIIFDVGGILFDDSLKNIEKLLHKDCKNIYKKAYGGNFKKCLLGEISVQQHIDSLKSEKEYKDIEFILKKENLYLSYPLIKENYEYIKKLKAKGYQLYLLTNITEDSYQYIYKKINISEIFTGGIYSFQEHLIKPDKKIYELLMNRFCLKKEETVFFEDDYYEYFFPCPKSDVYYIQIGNERRLLKDFLNENIVQISTLIDSGLDCIKKAKYESIKIKKEGYYISEVKIENEEVLKVENPIYYRENHNVFEFFLIPLQEGTTNITIRFILSGSGDLEEERTYKVKVDKNLKVSLENQEDFE